MDYVSRSLNDVGFTSPLLLCYLSSDQNALAAFRLMDRKCKGVVHRHDFKVLYNSLGFFCSKAEYEQLLHLIGLRPGGTLNYVAFANVLENDGKQGAPATSV